MSFNVVIPARYGSTRLPGKPLRLIGGRPLIQHVVARAQESGAQTTVVATDDERIVAAVEAFGGQAQMTDPGHRCGTDRVAEVAASRGWEDEGIVVNLQGDEPFMPGPLIHMVADALAARPEAVAATLAAPLTQSTAVMDSHVVKVVVDQAGYALYFSRAPIPWDRECFPLPEHAVLPADVYWRHIGLYAYRVGFLRQYVNWPESHLEQIELLEQLRILWHGQRMHVCMADRDPGFGVDTEQDLARADRLMQEWQ